MFNIDYFRQFRLFDYAIFDFVAAYLGILLLSPLLSKLAKILHLNINTKHWLWLTLPIGVAFHLVFKVDTPLNQLIFEPSGHFLEKIILLFMLFMGLKDIRKKS